MTCQDATRKRMTTQQQRITGGHLAHRSRGVTTLHHYERVSSRDLEWHRRDNERERGEVKLSCFFDQWVKRKNLENVKPFREKNTTEMNEVENTPLVKGNKEERILTTLRLKRDARLDKAKRTWAKGQNIPVKWIGTKRTLSKMMREKRKHHHDSGTKE